jgi:acyl carrier protein
MEKLSSNTAVDIYGKILSMLEDILQAPIDHDSEDVSRYELTEWDSMNHFRFIVELEEEFEISITDEEAADLSSLRQVESLVSSRGVMALSKGMA